MKDKESDHRETLTRSFIHDARTPLTSILGFSELLLEDESLAGQTREYLQIINDEANRLAQLIEKLSAARRAKDECDGLEVLGQDSLDEQADR